MSAVSPLNNVNVNVRYNHLDTVTTDEGDLNVARLLRFRYFYYLFLGYNEDKSNRQTTEWDCWQK